MHQPLRIAIIDDHTIVADGLNSLFDKEPGFDVVAVGYNSADAVSIAQLYEFDVMLLDLNLPDTSGLDTAKEILELNPEARILALTMNESNSMVKSCINAGICGYILKNTMKDDLLDAVTKVADGEIVLPQGLTLESMSEESTDTDALTIESLLTKREKQVLGHILQSETTQEIADTFRLSPHTVETHRRNIMHKLGVKNTAGLVKLAVSAGFKQ